jgi:C_GCAxxG_C_C family probable redox protein
VATVEESAPDLAYRLAFENESRYGSCGQAVLKALMDVFDLNLEDVLKASYPLAGGLSVSAHGCCGALAAGMLAIGSVYGRSAEEMPRGRYWKAYQVSRRLLEEFEAEFGSASCSDIQRRLFGRTFDLLDQGDFRKFEEMGGHRDKCPHVCGTAAKLTARILMEEGIPLRKAAGSG